MPRRKQQQSVDYEHWEHKGYFPHIKGNKRCSFIANGAAI